MQTMMKHSMYVAILLLAFGLIAGYIGISSQQQQAALRQSGIIVESLDTEGNTAVLRNGSYTILTIAPKFETKAGDIISCQAKIDHQMQQTLSTNPIVNIRYLAVNPEVCEVIGAKADRYIFPLFFSVIMILTSMALFAKVIWDED